MRVKLLTPIGNTLTIYGEKEKVIMDIKMLVYKWKCRLLDDKDDVVQLDEWLKKNETKFIPKEEG